MAIRGRFVSATTVVTTSERSRQNWGTTADPGHSQAAMGNDQGFPALNNAPVPVAPANVEDSYNPAGHNANTNALPAEREPRGHEGSGAPPRSDNRYDEIASDTRRHEINLGAMLKNTATMVMRSVTQTFASPLVESLPPSPDDTASATGPARRALRGFNSLAMNNPGSADVNHSGNYVRQGRELYRWTDRAMPRRTLTHTLRPIYSNVATIAYETKGPQGSNYSPYGSPYTSVASLNVGTARPMARREPRQWDESVITDGSETAYEQIDMWGM